VGIGDASRRDGLLLLVAMRERAIQFETGYGLEGTLPDGWQARMLRDLAVPRFREGDPAGASPRRCWRAPSVSPPRSR